MPDMDTGLERHRTDQGLTGDKIRVSDPAAAPVQTDAETAGTPTPADEVRASLHKMMETALAGRRPDTFGAWRHPYSDHQRRLGFRLLAWFSALVALGLLAGWWGYPG